MSITLEGVNLSLFFLFLKDTYSKFMSFCDESVYLEICDKFFSKNMVCKTLDAETILANQILLYETSKHISKVTDPSYKIIHLLPSDKVKVLCK